MRLEPFGPKMKPRHGLRAVTIGDHVIIYGGGDNEITDEGEQVYAYNVITNENIRFFTKGDIPPPRAAFGMTAIGSSILIFGGMGEYAKYRNDLYQLDTKGWVWHKINSFGQIPSPRIGHSFTAIDDKTILMFAGLTNDDHNEPIYLNDLFVLRIDDGIYKWRLIETTGLVPTPRESHSAVLYHDKKCNKKFLVIYGGMNGVNRLGDVYFLDVASMNWISPRTFGITPMARSLHSAAVINDKMYIFGGWVPCSSSEVVKNVIWKWKCTNAVSFLNLDTMAWKANKSTKRPAPRAGHCCAVADGRLYIWFGRDGHRLDEGKLLPQTCCEDSWYLEVQCPENNKCKIELIRATVDSLRLSWTPMPKAEFYLLELKKESLQEKSIMETKIPLHSIQQHQLAHAHAQMSTTKVVYTPLPQLYVPTQAEQLLKDRPKIIIHDNVLLQPALNEPTSIMPAFQRNFQQMSTAQAVKFSQSTRKPLIVNIKPPKSYRILPNGALVTNIIEQFDGVDDSPQHRSGETTESEMESKEDLLLNPQANDVSLN